jgi:hypothetical protein
MENGKNLIHSFNASDGLFGNFKGLTKREYFAGLAMQGLLANPNIKRPTYGDENGYIEFSNTCLRYADALLKQLD